MLVTCPAILVDTTLNTLREAGARHCEGIVLWLGQRGPNHIQVQEAYRPAHTAREDMFHISSAGMSALQAELRRRRLMVAAQVHSHPQAAFHSKADDRWAIIRHEGALSLVVPNFAAFTTTSRFLETTKIFRFSAQARWTEVPATETPACLQIL